MGSQKKTQADSAGLVLRVMNALRYADGGAVPAQPAAEADQTPMQPSNAKQGRAGAGALAWVSLMIALGASALVPWLFLAFSKEDTEALESPLALAVLRQLERGPWDLYGPYGGRYPLVLIHAPLYYRLAALLAWPMVRLGLDPLPAALVAGRSLSALGLVATLVAAFGAARLGGIRTRAAWWAALLVAATPTFGGLPFEVRPDMLAVGLQTSGALLVLAGLAQPSTAGIRLEAAFACFGLAICMKQHFVVTPAISTALLLAAGAHGRIGWKQIARPLLVAFAIILVCYGCEEWATSGRMSQSVFIAAASVGRVHPADWSFAGNILLALIWKNAGIILLAAAALVGIFWCGPGRARGAFAAVLTALIAATTALTVAQLLVVKMWLSASIVAGLILIMGCMIPLCVFLRWWSTPGGQVDRALCAFCVSELALALALCRVSTGGWFNYAIQAVVFACILVARAVARSFEFAPSRVHAMPAAIAVLAVPAFAFTDAREVLSKRAADRAEIVRLVDYLKLPSSERFFVDRPGDNRVYGRLDLVYDPWLYPVFESIGLAEPRARWLAQALEAGPIRVVLSTSNRFSIDGIPRSLPELGYRLSARVGPFVVWMRRSQQQD
jgi:hypothetical protein